MGVKMEAEAKTRGLVEKRRVMLIDDDREILDLLAEWLGGRGYEVRTLCEGTHALEEARRFRPHAVVLDGVLRGTTGVAVAQRLRAEGVEARIVFLSGLSRTELPSGELVLEKPIDLQVLERTLFEAPRGGAPTPPTAALSARL